MGSLSGFHKANRELTAPTTLALYDPAAETELNSVPMPQLLGWEQYSYRSTKRIGNLLPMHPIPFLKLNASRPKEKKQHWLSYGHVTIFSMYLLGKSFSVETDHKPLVPLLRSKHLDAMPP